MAVVAFDNVAETSASTGAGDLVFTGAIAGNRTFASVCADQDQFTYGIHDLAGGSYFESGIGRYNSAANSLTRLEIISSSNAGAAVVLPAGTKNIVLTVSQRQVRRVGAYPFTAAADGLMLRWNAKYSRTDIDTAQYVTKMYDISGNARHSDTNASNGPRWLPRGMLGGHAGVYFNGTKRMTFSALPGLGAPLACTILFIGKDFQILTGNSHLYNWGGNPIGFGTTTNLDYMYNGTLPTAHFSSNESRNAIPGDYALGYPIVGIHVYNGAASVQSLNGREETKSPGTAATGATNSFTLGSDSGTSPASWSKMMLWEIAVLSQAISAAKRAAYLAWVEAELDFRTS